MTYYISVEIDQVARTVEGWTVGDYQKIQTLIRDHPRTRFVSSTVRLCPRCSELAVFNVDKKAHPRWMDPNETGVLCLDCGFDGMCWCGCIANETGFCCDNCRKEANE